MVTVLEWLVFEVEAVGGLIGAWDGSRPGPTGEPGDRSGLDIFREQAVRGEIFFVDSEDPVKCTVEVVTSPEMPEHLAREFEPRGSFRLSLPSGRLCIGAVGDSNSAGLDLPPGEYVLTPYCRREFDPAAYEARGRELVGAARWQFHRRVDNLGALGCLLAVLAAALLLFRPVRPYAYIVVPVLLAPWALHLLMTRLPSYRQVEKALGIGQSPVPLLVFGLQESAVAREIPGGWIDAPQ